MQQLVFSIGTEADAEELAALHTDARARLTERFGKGPWTGITTVKGILLGLRQTRVLVARDGARIAGTLHLQTKKPWAIDVSYFTPVKKAIYLTSMAVLPAAQLRGVGRALLDEAARQVRAWPADAIRLDAFDAVGGAGGFYAKCGFAERGHVIYRINPLIYFERLLA
jgi:GNAT superfamily N-acetyltransferase